MHKRMRYSQVDLEDLFQRQQGLIAKRLEGARISPEGAMPHFTREMLENPCLRSPAWRDPLREHFADGKGFKRQDMFLAMRHPDAADRDVVFAEEPHLYYHFGKNDASMTSVSGLVHYPFKPFDRVAAYHAMGARHPLKGRSQEEVFALWEANANQASALGSATHQSAELWYNADYPAREALLQVLPRDMVLLVLPYLQHLFPVPATVHTCLAVLDDSREMSFFRDYHSCWVEGPRSTWFREARVDGAQRPAWLRGHRLFPFASEKILFDPRIKLSGTIDMLYYVVINGRIYLVMVDYKRSKAIKREGFRGKTGISPGFSHLADCNYSHYALQLNAYTRMLANIGHVVLAMFLCVLHPNQEAPLMIGVPHLPAETDHLMRAQRLLVQEPALSHSQIIRKTFIPRESPSDVFPKGIPPGKKY